MGEDPQVIFDADRHQRFARLSGDFNPIHMDPIAARRTQAGAPVVHGIHLLLSLIETLAPSLPGAHSLKAQFRKPVYVGDEATVEIAQHTPDVVKARMIVAGTEVLVASIGLKPKTAPQMTAGVELDKRDSAKKLSLQEMEGRSGMIAVSESVADLFPAAAAYLTAVRVAALACSSYLVGMEVPGLYSMYRGLDVALTAPPFTQKLGFEVSSVDARFSVIRLRIQGGGIAGDLETLARTPPVQQPQLSELFARVALAEFAHMRALVVGGSRGLGELTAKLIAAGGGKVTLTYASGKEDAQAIAREIGGSALRYDVLGEMPLLDAAPTHVFYFATPHISRRKAPGCDLERLAEFNRFYVEGFLKLAKACPNARIFYPSTVYVESRPAEMTEYAMAKAAGEILCADLPKLFPEMRILVRRLPRLPTDQNTGMLPGSLADPVETLLPILRELAQA